MYAITGNTFAHKSTLAQIGKWDAGKKSWIVDDKGKKRVEQACFRAIRSGDLRIVAEESVSVRTTTTHHAARTRQHGMYAEEKEALGLAWDFDA